MVVSTLNPNLHSLWGIDIYNQWFGTGAFHLYTVLMNREKALESIIVLVLACLFAYWRFELNWLVYLSLVLLSISFISKKLTLLIGKGWFAFSHYLGVTMNFVIMFVIFYFILTPLSFFQRLMGKNPISKSAENNSHFYKRKHLFSSKDLENPW